MMPTVSLRCGGAGILMRSLTLLVHEERANDQLSAHRQKYSGGSG